MFEIKVTVLFSGQKDNSTSLGGDLELPATKDNIKKFMEKAGVASEITMCTALHYEYRMDCLNNMLPERFRFDELNYLAQRLSDLSEYERMKFKGAAILSKNKELAGLINLTYNLDYYALVLDVSNDEQLGRYCLEAHKLKELKNMPSDMLKYLDYEKLGHQQRVSENGVYAGGNYVKVWVETNRQFYDGKHIPEEIIDTGYYIKLWLTSEQETEGTWLKLPALEDEIQVTLKKLKISDINECIVGKCLSILPNLDESVHKYTDLNDVIEKVNNLSYGIEQIADSEMMAKFEAALIYEDCKDFDFAADITQNLDCYDLYSSQSPEEEYGRKLAFERGYFNPSDSEILKCFDLEQYGRDQFEMRGGMATEYGMIVRNENEFYFEHHTPTMEQRI